MTLAEYDARFEFAHGLRKLAEEAEMRARKIERETNSEAGIGHANREPGFPCWRIKGLNEWFDTPRDAVEAMGAKRKAKVEK